MKICKDYFGEEFDADQCCFVQMVRERIDTHFNRLSLLMRTRTKRTVFKFQYSRNSGSTKCYTLIIKTLRYKSLNSIWFESSFIGYRENETSIMCCNVR